MLRYVALVKKPGVSSTHHRSGRSVWAWSTRKALLSLVRNTEIHNLFQPFKKTASVCWAVYWKLFTCSACCLINATKHPDMTVINRCKDKKTLHLQLGQGYPWGLQNQACQVILEDQRDLSFLGDLPTQTLPFTEKTTYHLIPARMFVIWHDWSTKWLYLCVSEALPWLPSLLVFPRVLELQGGPA